MNKFLRVSLSILLIYILYIAIMLVIGFIVEFLGISVNYLILGVIGFGIASFIIYVIWLQWKRKNKLSEGE